MIENAFCRTEVTSAALKGVPTSAASVPALGINRSVPDPLLRIKVSGLLNSEAVDLRIPEASVP